MERRRKHRYWSEDEKRQIVAQARAPGVSAASTSSKSTASTSSSLGLPAMTDPARLKITLLELDPAPPGG